MRPLYQLFANCLVAFDNCQKNKSFDWANTWEKRVNKLASKHLPHGSGFDYGTTFDFDGSLKDKLIFHTSFHHMDEAGFYGDWTEHTITVTPSLIHGFTVSVSGRNKNNIKEYITEIMANVLNTQTEYED